MEDVDSSVLSVGSAKGVGLWIAAPTAHIRSQIRVAARLFSMATRFLAQRAAPTSGTNGVAESSLVRYEEITMHSLTAGENLRRRSASVGLLAAGFLLVYLVAVSPHLVHHLFEEHHGHPSCPLLVQSQQTTAELQPDPPLVGPPVLMGTLADQKATAFLPSPPAHTSQPRAPPTGSPSV